LEIRYAEAKGYAAIRVQKQEKSLMRRISNCRLPVFENPANRWKFGGLDHGNCVGKDYGHVIKTLLFDG
jgi:hypothetical protein